MIKLVDFEWCCDPKGLDPLRDCTDCIGHPTLYGVIFFITLVVSVTAIIYAFSSYYHNKIGDKK